MPPPIKTNPLGQIADSVVEQLKSAGSQAAQAVVSEPAKILEQILGGWTDESATADPSKSSGQANDQVKQLKIAEEERKKQVLIQQFHNKLKQEEQEYYAKFKHEEEMKKKQKEDQEKQQAQIVQLQKEKQKEEAWQQQLKAVQGSHEGQMGKM